MNQKIGQLLLDKGENHIAPFFWQHGEPESVLRKYMKIIQNSGCGAVCVESRPHPDFCGPGWWRDLDVILDEARKRSMKVWILDDSHFPTGYANGQLEQASNILCRQSVFSNPVSKERDSDKIRFCVKDYVCPPELKLNMLAEIMSKMTPEPRKFDDDILLSVTAFSAEKSEIIDLTEKIKNGILEWELLDESWEIYVNGLSRNCGPHRNYINMMNKQSCRVLIDTVYEAHYRHYKDDFGKTIVGFFSDEPELGNGTLYMQHNRIGTEQDLPWSTEVEREMENHLGTEWRKFLPLLWHLDAGKEKAAKIRYIYMDIVTRLVREDFSVQVGNWCREHGVEYIGHVIEDEGQHCRTASSLGHYFRGLEGQSMAGIDVIGGQIMPGCEDFPKEGILGRTRNGEFYHYGLAMLAASAAAVEPWKNGRAMCEIFGNYGWKAGVKLERYLADHCLVRGINFFVPHAFSPKKFPDPDCPPHFYAHGHNPQYRHFGVLIRYMNRVSELFSGGRRIVTAAVLYHGESEWCGSCMPFETVARELYDHQICCDVIPSDVFAEPEKYKTELGRQLKVNTQEYQILIIPEAEFITREVMEAISILQKKGVPVLFINSVPGCCTGDARLAEKECQVIPLSLLAEEMQKRSFYEIQLEPSDNRIRFLHYQSEQSMYMFVNEGDSVYRGTVNVPESGPCYRYDAMENRIEKVVFSVGEKWTELELELYPEKSLIVIFDEIPEERISVPLCPQGEKELLLKWKRSQCRSIEYPEFTNEKEVELPDKVAEEQESFSGFVRYETTVRNRQGKNALMEISEAFEGCELFINNVNAGIQIASPMRYDLSGILKPGKNQVRIEVATTLERAMFARNCNYEALQEPPICGSGITGVVAIYWS